MRTSCANLLMVWGDLCQFVNGLGRELREVLIRQDDFLKKQWKQFLYKYQP